MSEQVNQQGNGTTRKRMRIPRTIGQPQHISEVPLPLKGTPTTKLEARLRALQPEHSIPIVGYSAITAKKVANTVFGPDEKIVVAKDDVGTMRIWRLPA